MINPGLLQNKSNSTAAVKTALEAYQSRKGRIPLQIQDLQLFEQIFHEYKHLNYTLFKSFLLTIKSASLQVRTEFGKSEVLVRGFSSILRKHEATWLDPNKVNFDLIIDTIEVLSLLRIPSELLLQHDLGKAVKSTLAKAAQNVDPRFPLLGHAKKTYNQMKVNWLKFIEEEKNSKESAPKRKASDDNSSSKRQKVVGPWTIKQTEPTLEDVSDSVDAEEDFIMVAKVPLGTMKSYPKGILKSSLKNLAQEEGMNADVGAKTKRSVQFDMNKNSVKRIDKIAKHDKKSMYSERGEASRALKQKVRIEWRTPRELEHDFTVFERGMESEETRTQTNRERSSNPVQYSSILSIPESPREVVDIQTNKATMYNDLKFFKWSRTESRPENLQYFASYVLLPQLNMDTEMSGSNLLQLEELKAALIPSMRCPFETCKAGPYCGFKHDIEA